MRLHRDAAKALAADIPFLNFRRIFRGFAVAALLGGGIAMAQGPVPDSLVLKAKVRDFREINNTGAAPTHPHFYGMGGHPAGCATLDNPGQFAVLADIDTSGQENSAVFRGDKRGPRINAAMPARMLACYTPVDRFTDWFEDRGPDVNRAFLIDLRFTRNPATGVYTYSNPNFFPIDNGARYTPVTPGQATFGHLLTGPSYGVESSLHNYGFTMEFHTEFTYLAGTNQTFAFQGDDDVWAFINGKRVIDLGGPHPAHNANVNLDQQAAALGLVDRQKYPLDFFFAERHTSTSSLVITTSLELRPLPVLAPPVLEPAREFLDRTQVAITHPVAGVTIHYTVDGSTPTSASPVYSGPIPLSATTTVKAIAVKADHLNSAVAQSSYTRIAPGLPAPVADPRGREFTGTLSVSLTVPGVPDAVIRYTLDGTEPTAASPAYKAALVFTGTTILKAKAFHAAWQPSPALEEQYRRLAAPLRGVYADDDGDGRIDMALIRMDIAPLAPPAAITLQDPFSMVESSFSGAALTLGADPAIVVVRFEDKPFTLGTGFPTGDYGKLLGSPGFSPAPFPIADSAGPALVKAVVKHSAGGSEKPYLDVTFTEPLDQARLGLAWPFTLLRNGAPVTDAVRVVSVGPVPGSPNTYRWTLDPESPALPVYIDSLALASSPLVHDAAGISGAAGKKKVPVEGEKPILTDTILVGMSKPVSDQPLQGGDVLTLPPGKENLIGSLVGASDGTLTCLSCQKGTESRFIGAPEWTVRSRHPFRYTFRIFDNLGQHVATASGEVKADALGQIPRDANGYRTVRFRWVPAGVGNRRAGTGAYVLKGLISTDQSQAPRGIQGEPIELAAAQTEVLLTFGFLRK